MALGADAERQVRFRRIIKQGYTGRIARCSLIGAQIHHIYLEITVTKSDRER